MQGARCRHSSTRAHPGATKDPLANTKSLNRSGGIDLSQSKGPGEPGPNSRDALVVSTNFSKRADARQQSIRHRVPVITLFPARGQEA
jgi:hypothetical protein